MLIYGSALCGRCRAAALLLGGMGGDAVIDEVVVVDEQVRRTVTASKCLDAALRNWGTVSLSMHRFRLDPTR